MLSLITSFVEELRAVGVPVSMVEAIDSVNAVGHVDLGDRTAFKETLRSTLIKNSRHEPAFETAFEVFFADRSRLLAFEPDELAGSDIAGNSEGSRQSGTGSGGSGRDLQELIDSLFNAMAQQDFGQLRQSARDAIEQLAGMEPGRPVGGTYYLYRTLRQLDIDDLEQRLLEAMLAEHPDADDLEQRLINEEVSERIEQLRGELEDEIRRRLDGDPG